MIKKSGKIKIVVILLIPVILISYKLYFSNRFIFLIHKDKILIHKVNSIKKLNKVAKKYQGVELDVVYDKNKNIFDIYHPPEASVGLSLFKYFQSLDRPSELKYWLDYKNLNDINEAASLNRLKYLANNFNINKQNIIVESTKPENLQSYDIANFNISYYLAKEWYKKEGEELNNCIETIKQNLVKYPGITISSNYKAYELMCKIFPDNNKLLWYSGGYGKYNRWEDTILLHKIVSDDKVKILLIPAK